MNAHPVSAIGDRGPLAAVAPVAILAAIGAATAAAALGQRPAMALVPVALLAAGYLVVKMPLHLATAWLVVLMLVPDSRADGVGAWRSPISFLGDLFDVAWKANLRNVALLDRFVAGSGQQTPSRGDYLFVFGLLLALLAVIMIPLLLLLVLLQVLQRPRV